MRNERIRVIVEIALCIALAAVLNTLKIWRMPNAGTVSFVMLPIVVISLRRGLTVGLITGALYGIVDMIIDPYPPVTWVQPLLDYPIAYGLVGLSGVLAGRTRDALAGDRRASVVLAVVTGTLMGTLARYGAHVLSGIVFFAQYAPEGQPVAVYSVLYNLYVPVSGLLAGAAAVVLIPVLNKSVPVEARDTQPGRA